jgi:hypothetical protein
VSEEQSRVIVLTDEQALANARRYVAALAPLTEEEAWDRAQRDPYGELSPEQRNALENLDTLDWMMTGQGRGCHYGACLDRVIDISWRA